VPTVSSRGRLSACAQIDRLVCGDPFVPDKVWARATALQNAARRLTAGAPLSEAIVRALLVQRGGRVALFTGFVVPDTCPHGENDGPLGTVVLARALHRAGFAPEIRVDPDAVDHVNWLAAELGTRIPIQPIDPHQPGRSPDIAIAIEKPGRNRAGFLHTWSGRRIESGSIPVDAFFRELDASGKLTVGIGDRGNEIGFGAIRHQLRALVPESRRCTCGCDGGTAAITPTRLLYPAAVSNWGAYGLCAALSLATGDRSLTLLEAEEERLLNVAAVRGCRDGLLGAAAFGVDGIEGRTSVRVVAALRALVDLEMEIEPPVRGPIEGRNEALRG